MKFEWDRAKAVKNRRNLGVSFEEARQALEDPLALTGDDLAQLARRVVAKRKCMKRKFDKSLKNADADLEIPETPVEFLSDGDFGKVFATRHRIAQAIC